MGRSTRDFRVAALAFASSDVRIGPPQPSSPRRVGLRRLARALALATSVAGGAAADEAPLRVAVYDAPPYGHLEADGSISGVSVELWRRTAEMLGRKYRLIPVGEMKAVIEGVARNDYDAAIGAITITPERLARVDFSYPAHRSGVAVALRKESGPLAPWPLMPRSWRNSVRWSRSHSGCSSRWLWRCGWRKGRCARRATIRRWRRCATASIGRSSQ